MALVNKFSLSSLSSSFNSSNTKSINSKTRLYSLHFNTTASPFTEKHSLQRYQRDQWIYNNLQDHKPLDPTSCSDEDSIRQHDIVLQLPELKKLLQVLKEKREEKLGPGNVYLVGTGPGDPELLTIKAMKVIQKADLLLYDRLVSTDVLDLVGPNARLLYVGKTTGYHSRTQEEIHELLLSFAEAGANVVRLKGGDPLVYAELKDLADEITSTGLISPTLIIIGKVVSLSPFWPYSSTEAMCLTEAK